MTEIQAFIGHSFADQDKDIVSKFLDFFDHVSELDIGFSWDHAEIAEPKLLSEKVREKMEDKNVFIGICTGKEKVITADKLKSSFIFKEKVCSDYKEFETKTSDWILQEIGFAFGRDLDIILLLEDGLRRPGGLQGDIEYIYFSRESPEKCYTQILEMIKALMPIQKKKQINQREEAVEQEVDSKVDAEDKDSTLEIREDWTQGDFENGLFFAIFKNEDAKEEEIFNEYFNRGFASDDYERIAWEAKRKYHLTFLGHSDHFGELLAIHNQNPSHDIIQYYLGQIYYFNYAQYDEAADLYLSSARDSKSETDKISRLASASRALSKAGRNSEALLILEEIKNLSQTVPNRSKFLLDILLEASSNEENEDQFLAFSEAYLDLRPNDHDKRFSLAYKYSEIGEPDFAIYHYLKLRTHRPNDTSENNLGVSYGDLVLPSKAVEAFNESIKMGGTLAMSNLAHKLIEGGFLAEAEELCNQATQKENYDKQVGTAISRIKEVRKEEESKEKNILEKLKPRRELYSKYGKGCIEKQIEFIDGTWRSPETNIKIEIVDNKLIGEGFLIEKKKPSLSVPSLSRKEQREVPDSVKFVIKYEGEVLGRSVTFKKWKFEQGQNSSSSHEIEAEGLMVISNDLNNIDVYEKGTRAKEKFYKLIRLDQNDSKSTSEK